MNADDAPHPGQKQPDVPHAANHSVHAIFRREKAEPIENYSPLSLALLGLMGACALFSAFYLGRFSGDFDPMVYDERILPGMLEGGAPPVPVTPAVMGKRVYTVNCVACHQPTGLGLPGAYPALSGSEWVAGPEERIIRVLLNGISGPITVKGSQFVNSMPAFGPQLKDDQIANVLTYIRSEWGNTASPVTVDKVKAIRASVAARTAPWTAEELLKIP